MMSRLHVVKRFWPYLLIGMGLCLIICGFAYDVTFVGVPYQDPTPEMSDRYVFHAHVAFVIYSCGQGILLAGVVAGIIRHLAGRFSKPAAS